MKPQIHTVISQEMFFLSFFLVLMSICLAVPVLADTMGMASIIQRRQEGAEREENREGGKTKRDGDFPPLESFCSSHSAKVRNHEHSWERKQNTSVTLKYAFLNLRLSEFRAFSDVFT